MVKRDRLQGVKKMEKWKIGDRIAYKQDQKWTVSILIRLTKTQGILENNRRFRLEDGYLLNAPDVPVFVSLEKEVKEKIEEWLKEEEDKKELSKQKARLHDLITHIQVSYYSRLNLKDIKAIADCIEKRIK